MTHCTWRAPGGLPLRLPDVAAHFHVSRQLREDAARDGPCAHGKGSPGFVVKTEGNVE